MIVSWVRKIKLVISIKYLIDIIVEETSFSMYNRQKKYTFQKSEYYLLRARTFQIVVAI